MTKIQDYKGYAINVDDTGVFSAHQYVEGETYFGEALVTDTTLKALLAKVDRLSKQKFGQPVLIEISRGWGEDAETIFPQGKISSMKQDQGRSRTYTKFIVTWKDTDNTNRREELYAGKIYKDTPTNRGRINLILDLTKEIAAKQAALEKAKESLESYTPEELGVAKEE